MNRFNKLLFLGFLIFGFAHLVYWKNYWKPEVFFWDENYHIASAAKYLKGVFFMEPHPPLGKLLIALGEKLVDINNGHTFGFEKFDIIPNQPHQIVSDAFSFAGYRFFPALFSVFNVLIFSAIIFFITESYTFTAAFSALPLLDTALILHSRAAMLDSFLLFGHLICIFGFLVLLRLPANDKKKVTFFSFLMSFGFFFAFMTKLFGLALIVLWPILYFYKKESRQKFRRLFVFNFLFVSLLSLSIWIIHIQLGKNVQVSLMNNGTYLASSDYEKWLLGLEKDSWIHLPQKLYENIRFSFLYEENVAGIDWEEHMVTGSYPIEWPFGSRPILYRWQKTGNLHNYLYMIPNPWAWGFGLLGLILSLSFWIKKGKRTFRENPELTSMILLYFCYFLPMCFIHRVLYLYHYFPMLFISWILLALFLQAISRSIGAIWNKRIAIALCLMPIVLFQGFYMYRNFIYFTPLDCRSLKEKNIFPFWGMKFQSCNEEENQRRFLQQFKGSEP